MCWDEWKIVFQISLIFSVWFLVFELLVAILTIRLQKKKFGNNQILREDADLSDIDFLYDS